MNVIRAVFTVTGALCWCSWAVLAALLAWMRRGARRDAARRETQVVAHAEALLRDARGDR